MNSAQLVGEETDHVFKKLFRDEFYTSGIWPTIIGPETNGAKTTVESIFESTPAIFSNDNKTNFENAMEGFGKESFRQVIKRINSVPPKLPSIDDDDELEPHLSILAYLKKSGISVGRVPKPPQFHSAQLL
ncbi:unnamed protein product [Caenorhabditis brenneri]